MYLTKMKLVRDCSTTFILVVVCLCASQSSPCCDERSHSLVKRQTEGTLTKSDGDYKFQPNTTWTEVEVVDGKKITTTWNSYLIGEPGNFTVRRFKHVDVTPYDGEELNLKNEFSIEDTEDTTEKSDEVVDYFEISEEETTTMQP